MNPFDELLKDELPQAIYAVAGDWKGVKHSLYLSERNVKLRLAQLKRYYKPDGLRANERIYKLTGVTGDVLNWTDVTGEFVS